MRRTLTIALIACLPALPVAAACSAADVEIKNWKWVRDAGWFVISGELVNRCKEPTAPRLQITLNDDAGRLLSQEDAWPTGQRNLRANETFPFRVQTRGYASAKAVTIKIGEVRQLR